MVGDITSCGTQENPADTGNHDGFYAAHFHGSSGTAGVDKPIGIAIESTVSHHLSTKSNRSAQNRSNQHHYSMEQLLLNHR